jgi:predicted amidohydrolase
MKVALAQINPTVDFEGNAAKIRGTALLPDDF